MCPRWLRRRIGLIAEQGQYGLAKTFVSPGGNVRPDLTSGSSPDRIDIETLAHVEAEHAIRGDVGVDQRRQCA